MRQRVDNRCRLPPQLVQRSKWLQAGHKHRAKRKYVAGREQFGSLWIDGTIDDFSARDAFVVGNQMPTFGDDQFAFCKKIVLLPVVNRRCRGVSCVGSSFGINELKAPEAINDAVERMDRRGSSGFVDMNNRQRGDF